MEESRSRCVKLSSKKMNGRFFVPGVETYYIIECGSGFYFTDEELVDSDEDITSFAHGVNSKAPLLMNKSDARKVFSRLKSSEHAWRNLRLLKVVLEVSNVKTSLKRRLTRRG